MGIRDRPEPVNAEKDDVGITRTPNGTRAYLASNRKAGMGMDDIYLLRLKQGITSLQVPEIDGETFTVYDGANSRRASGAQVWTVSHTPLRAHETKATLATPPLR